MELRGFTYELAGQLEEAIRSFERAIRLSPFDRGYLEDLQEWALHSSVFGRFDEAVAAAKNALQKNQDYGPAYRCLAAALGHLGRDAEARRRWPSSLRLSPISEYLNG